MAKHIPSPMTYEEATVHLAELLKSTDPEIAEITQRLISNFRDKFFRIVFYPGLAPDGRTDNSIVRFEPSELMLRLLSAIRANNRNQVIVINHELRS